MTLANYADLQAAAVNWMERAGQAGAVADWIALAEAKLNRRLGAVETDATLSGTIGSRSIDIAGLSMVQPIALFLAPIGQNEELLTPKADGTFTYRSGTGRPRFWAIDGQRIDFDCPLSVAWPLRFRYRERFSLAQSSTNWLLTNHPDVYLAATLMWGAGYNEDWSNGSVWKGVLDEAIPEIKNQIAQNKRGTATADPALMYPGRMRRYGKIGLQC